MDQTNILVLGNNLISNLLRKILRKNKIDHLNFAYPVQEAERRFFAIKPIFLKWYSDCFSEDLDNHYPIKHIQIFVENEKLNLNDNLTKPFPLFNIMASDYLFSSFSKDLDNINKVINSAEELEFVFDNNEVIFKNYQISSKLIINTDFRFNKFLNFKPEREEKKEYDEFAVTASFKTDTNLENRAEHYFREAKILAILPYADHEFSIVLSGLKKGDEKFLNDSGEKLINFINKQTNLRSVKLASKINHFPLSFYKIKHDPKLRSLYIGDAGHRVHPLAGLGLNLGLGDIQMIDSLISDKRIIDPGQENFIKKYAISRSIDESIVMHLTDHLDEALVNNSEVFSALFKYPIKIAENSELLKKALVRMV